MKYGVSFNCTFNDGDGEVGGGGDGCVSLDYVGDDMLKIVKAVKDDSREDFPLVFSVDDVIVGEYCDLGGNIVGVFLSKDEDVVAVMFENPNLPIVVE